MKQVHSPLDPFSEVVNENRRWTPEWYSWLAGLSPFVGTVAELPPASTVPGARAFVTDATPPTTFLSTLSGGGGTNKVPVVSDGTDWLIG